MHYISTNRHLSSTSIKGYKDSVTFREALFTGQAPDMGLFVPESIPALSPAKIEGLKNRLYSEVAFEILKLFLQNELPEEVLRSIIKQAYNFDIPVESLGGDTWLVRLDQGPTASFKDFAARFMARAMAYFKPEDQQVTILVATSGDTGSAIGEAFKGLEGFKVYIIYPEDEVSNIQKKQLNSIGQNVQAIAIDGKFDDCQAIVKETFSDQDPDLKPLNLTSANSINLGRILPQIVYYFYSYVNCVDSMEPAIVSVPSGNFGNSLGCEIARRMGLPVEKIIIATNANDEFPAFMETEEYHKIEPSRRCLSNAMNVGNPSNLARYFDLYGGTIDKSGKVYNLPDVNEMRKHLYSIAIDDTETIETMIKYYKEFNTLLEPHGAVGVAALEHYKKETNATHPSISIETAHPSKFPEIIKEELNVAPEPHSFMNALDNTQQYTVHLAADYHKFKQYIKEKHHE